jgi:RNA polymerase sigma-70 factor (ECF subfamily)
MTFVDRESELSLVARLRAGDPAALDCVHAEYHVRLLTFLTRLSRSRSVAEDLLEETWLRLVGHAHKLRPDTELARWLFTVARNLHVSYCRSRAIERDRASDLIGLWPAGSPQSSPFEVTAANETERRLEAALACLPASYREVLLLVGVEGLAPSEVAAICGASPETIRQRLHRARTMLVERMDEMSATTALRVSEALS